ncbi:MAG: hypothetical protein ACREU2_17925, partial [Steroidobacteraceae bacterium]
RCDNCMAHCGFEGTAAEDTFRHPIKALTISLRGPRVDGPMAPEVPFVYEESAHARAGAHAAAPAETTVPLQALKRASRSQEAVGTDLH